MSSSQVLQIEKIQKQAAPEVVAAVKAGAISINAAATVATLPLEEQPGAEEGGTADQGEDTVETLRQRVAALTADNMRLREQLARLQPGTAAE